MRTIDIFRFIVPLLFYSSVFAALFAFWAINRVFAIVVWDGGFQIATHIVSYVSFLGIVPSPDLALFFLSAVMRAAIPPITGDNPVRSAAAHGASVKTI